MEPAARLSRPELGGHSDTLLAMIRASGRAHGWWLVLALSVTSVMLFRLGRGPVHFDESVHGVASLEMLERGDWLTPHCGGQPYFKKPPLKLWLTALLFYGWGPSPWTLRLPNALAGLLTCLWVARWTWELSRSRLEAFLAGLMLATIRPTFVHGYKSGEMDGLLALGVVAALYGWWRATTSPPTAARGWLLAVGAAIGLGVMVKSAAGLLPLLVIVPDAWLRRSFRTVRARDLIPALALSAGLALPWHLAIGWRHGLEFWNVYLGQEVLTRWSQPLFGGGRDAWWYLEALGRGLGAYAAWLIPAATWALVRDRSDREVTMKGAAILLLLWLAVPAIAFSIARTKFEWYLLPLYPAAVMLIVRFLAAARTVQRDWLAAAGHAGAVVLWAAGLRSMLPAGSRSDELIETLLASFGPTPALAALIGGAASVSLYALHRLRPRRVPQAALALVLSLAVGLGLLGGRYLFAPARPAPFERIAAAVARSPAPLVCLAVEPTRPCACNFDLRSRLGPGRIHDAGNDPARALDLMRVHAPAFLLVGSTTELPHILRSVEKPRRFGGLVLWSPK